MKDSVTSGSEGPASLFRDLGGRAGDFLQQTLARLLMNLRNSFQFLLSQLFLALRTQDPGQAIVAVGAARIHFDGLLKLRGSLIVLPLARVQNPEIVMSDSRLGKRAYRLFQQCSCLAEPT